MQKQEEVDYCGFALRQENFAPLDNMLGGIEEPINFSEMHLLSRDRRQVIGDCWLSRLIGTDLNRHIHLSGSSLFLSNAGVYADDFRLSYWLDSKTLSVRKLRATTEEDRKIILPISIVKPKILLMKLTKGTQYRIKWIDAFAEAKWTDEEELGKLIAQFEKPIEQTLYFIKSSPDFYVFTSGKLIEDMKYVDIHGIPKGWITKIKQIKN